MLFNNNATQVEGLGYCVIHPAINNEKKITIKAVESSKYEVPSYSPKPQRLVVSYFYFEHFVALYSYFEHCCPLSFDVFL